MTNVRHEVRTRAIACALTLFLITPTLVARQGAGSAPTDAWIAEPGGQAKEDAGVMTVRRGTIRTARLYSDFVLRFEFRLAAPNSAGRVFLRSRFGYGSSRSDERGYYVGLTSRIDGAEALGRISGAQVGMQEKSFTPAGLSSLDGGWQALEVQAIRGQVTIRVNGRPVSSADSLDEFTGYIAMQAIRGDGIQFRNIFAQRYPSAGDPFGRGARRTNEPGLTLPRVLKSTKPFYPKEPHDSLIQGGVGLEVVVDTTGRAGDIRVTKPLHPDLDEAAIGCARQWKFAPATMSGEAVPVIVTMEISFRRT